MNFYLPDFYNHYQLNIKIIQLLQEHPEYFYDNLKIGAVYGTYPGAIWNGGRTFLDTTDLNNIKATTEAFNSQNIPLRFTFTNCLLEEKHLLDTYCNLIMETSNNGMNGIIINSELLEQFLRNSYPNYKYILSTTRCERDINKINELCDQYDMVVIDYRDNSNFDFLSKLNNKDKIELLINAYCSPNCKNRKEHYEYLSQCQLNFSRPDSCQFNTCPTYDRNFFSSLEFDSVIKVVDLYSKYSDLGFSNFKIEGRTLSTFNVLESYLYYLIKPEYQNEVRFILNS